MRTLWEGEFCEFPIRVLGTVEEPLFCAVDVFAALELEPGNGARTIPEDEKEMVPVQTPGGPQRMTMLTEAGLYRLIFRSYKPRAEEFRRWVFREVLPAIRRTGRYAVEPGREPWEVKERAALVFFRELTGCGLEPEAALESAVRAVVELLTVKRPGPAVTPALTQARLWGPDVERLLELLTAEGGKARRVPLQEVWQLARGNGLFADLAAKSERAALTQLGTWLPRLTAEGVGGWMLLRVEGSRTAEFYLTEATK